MPGPGGYWLRPDRSASTAASTAPAGPSWSGKPCPRLRLPVRTARADISEKMVGGIERSRWAIRSLGGGLGRGVAAIPRLYGVRVHRLGRIRDDRPHGSADPHPAAGAACPQAWGAVLGRAEPRRRRPRGAGLGRVAAVRHQRGGPPPAAQDRRADPTEL